jgi:hypothetical protein
MFYALFSVVLGSLDRDFKELVFSIKRHLSSPSEISFSWESLESSSYQGIDWINSAVKLGRSILSCDVNNLQLAEEFFKTLTCPSLETHDKSLADSITELQLICKDLQHLGFCLDKIRNAPRPMTDNSLRVLLQCSADFQANYGTLQDKPFFVALKSEALKLLESLPTESHDSVKLSLWTKIYNKISWFSGLFLFFACLAVIAQLFLKIYPDSKKGAIFFSVANGGMIVVGAARMISQGKYASMFGFEKNWLIVWPALSKTLLYVFIPGITLMVIHAIIRDKRKIN